MIIQIGSPEHNAHLIGVEQDRIIAENQSKIVELKEQLKSSTLEYRAATPEDLEAINKQKELADINRQISELEHPKVANDFLKASRQSECDAGFEIGKNRQQLEQSASEQKRAGYLAGNSAGNGGSATSPQTAFGKQGKSEMEDFEFQEGVNLAQYKKPLPANSSQSTKDGFYSVSNQ